MIKVFGRLAIPILFIFMACGGTVGKQEQKVISFDNPQLIEEEFENWIKVSDAVQLDIPDSIIVGRVNQIEFTNQGIFLLDYSDGFSILHFDKNGKLKTRLSKTGNGPGEYGSIEFFLLRETSLVVYDRSSLKLIEYTLPEMKNFSELKVEDYYVGGISQVSNGGVFLVSDSDLQKNTSD